MSDRLQAARVKEESDETIEKRVERLERIAEFWKSELRSRGLPVPPEVEPSETGEVDP